MTGVQTCALPISVKYGGTGVQHEWKVDGETVSTDAVFSRAFDGKGQIGRASCRERV